MPELCNPYRIFVVDDEPAIAFTLARILCHHGYDATPFTKSTVALLASHAAAPHLLLTDAFMPAMSGMELGIEVRKYAPGCKVLVLSGQHPSAALLDPCHSPELEFEFLEKPVRPAALLQKIQSMTGRALPAQPIAPQPVPIQSVPIQSVAPQPAPSHPVPSKSVASQPAPLWTLEQRTA